MMEREKKENLFSFLHSNDTSIFIALLLYIVCANKLTGENVQTRTIFIISLRSQFFSSFFLPYFMLEKSIAH